MAIGYEGIAIFPGIGMANYKEFEKSVPLLFAFQHTPVKSWNNPSDSRKNLAAYRIESDHMLLLCRIWHKKKDNFQNLQPGEIRFRDGFRRSIPPERGVNHQGPVRRLPVANGTNNLLGCREGNRILEFPVIGVAGKAFRPRIPFVPGVHVQIVHSVSDLTRGPGVSLPDIHRDEGVLTVTGGQDGDNIRAPAGIVDRYLSPSSGQSISRDNGAG